MIKAFKDLNKKEINIFRKLNTPKKIQDFLEKLPINFEEKGDTLMSPRCVLRERKAHCIEGAIFAAAVLRFHGKKPILLDLITASYDEDHVVALFKKNGLWGAISKTNHAVLRYREPVYRNVRELAMSYFHEYFVNDGEKTMRGYSEPFNLSRFDKDAWLTSEDDLWHIAEELHDSRHHKILTKSMLSGLRYADPIEREAGKLTHWEKNSGK
ncbi:MAG: hypothetical protein WD898_00840 [Candidatus Paceibacterota bacterium]